MLDMHCHILPAVDHGAKDLVQARDMLKAAAEQGITEIVGTPHVYHEDFDISIACKSFQALWPYAKELGIKLHLGYEVNIRALNRDKLEQARNFCMEGTNTLLLELPFEHWPLDWKHVIYDLQACGMDVIIAHPERYEPVQKNLSILDQMAGLDCRFQVDIPQAMRRFTKQNRVLKRLIAMDCLHFAASDAHEAKDYRNFDQSVMRLAPYLHCRDWNEEGL